MIYPKMSLNLLELLILEEIQIRLDEEMLLVDNQECFPDTVASIGHTVIHKSDTVPGKFVGEVTEELTGINNTVCEHYARRTVGQ